MAAQAPRAMAMAQASSAPQMAITANWSGEMRFPQLVRLPVPIAISTLGPGQREILIKNPGQELPGLVIQWMQSDPRYRTWFLSGEAKTTEATAPVEEPEAEPVAVEVEAPADDEPEPDKPKRSRRKKNADD